MYDKLGNMPPALRACPWCPIGGRPFSLGCEPKPSTRRDEEARTNVGTSSEKAKATGSEDAEALSWLRTVDEERDSSGVNELLPVISRA